MSVLRAAKPVHEFGQRVDRFAELLALTAQRSQHGVEVDDHLPDQLIAVGQRVGQRRGLRQKRADRRALALERRDQLPAQGVDLSGSSARNNGRKPPISGVQIQRRLGAVERYRGARGAV